MRQADLEPDDWLSFDRLDVGKHTDYRVALAGASRLLNQT